MKRQAHVTSLADQNDEDRLFQVQAIFWCVVSMQICFSSNMAYNHVMTKKKKGFLENIAKSAHICRFEASLSSYLYA